MIDKGREYNYRDFSARWREKLPALRVLNVEAESHLTLLTEPASQKVISEFCARLYSGEERMDQYIKTLSNE